MFRIRSLFQAWEKNDSHCPAWNWTALIYWAALDNPEIASSSLHLDDMLHTMVTNSGAALELEEILDCCPEEMTVYEKCWLIFVILSDIKVNESILEACLEDNDPIIRF